jgi:uncharacterized protein (TIGR03437 family)
MKLLSNKKPVIFIGLLILLPLIINCGVWSSQAAGTLTAAEIESMAKRATEPSKVTGAQPELPRVYLDTTYVPPTGGRTIAVNAGGDFQVALNQAQPGDVITLQAGATFTGTFTLPAKTGSGWITIRTSAPDSSLPPPGTRITPAYANVLPKILAPTNGVRALEAANGAHHYRLMGLEFGIAPGIVKVFSIINLGETQTSLAQLPHNIIVDRVYIHGSATADVRRGIALNSASSAVIDSYISDCHERGADSQAILGWNGPGPFKIVNNYLEGAGENIMFGGATPTIPNLVPSDIEFRRNHCFKPLVWKADDPSHNGIDWSIKNLFELKNAQRVLVEGNIFEQNWQDSQVGFAIVLTVRNEEGTAPWAVVQDVTFINNIVRRSAGGVAMHGRDDISPPPSIIPSRRFKIANNLFDDIDSARWSNGSGRLFQIISGVGDLTIDHNTAMQSGNIVVADVPPPNEGFVFTNNLMPNNEYGFFGSGQGQGTVALNHYFPGAVFRKNAIIGGPSGAYPADNFFPATFDTVKFVNRGGGNYRLDAASPYKNAGTDGKDIGCDFDALNAAMSPLAALSSVSAASYAGTSLAPESIAAAFGTALSTATASTSTIPLPTTLAGTSVKARDSIGVERLCPLFLVSPTQINYLIPAETAAGAATITVINGNTPVAAGMVSITPVAPGLFTADATGRGLPTAITLRVKSDGSLQYETVARFDAAQNKFVAVPIDLGASTDQLFLVLYGTGLRFRSSLPAVTAKIGGLDAQVPFAGAQGSLVGLDQVNLRLSPSLAGRGEVDVLLTVDGQPVNAVRVVMK